MDNGRINRLRDIIGEIKKLTEEYEDIIKQFPHVQKKAQVPLVNIKISIDDESEFGGGHGTTLSSITDQLSLNS